MTRRTYLAESVGDLHSKLSASQGLASTGDPFEISADYFKLIEKQERVKIRIERAAQAYETHILSFDAARRKFQERKDSVQQVEGGASRFKKLEVHDSLSLELLAIQEARDLCEVEYRNLLRVFEESLKESQQVREAIGDGVVAAAEPHYFNLRQIESEMLKENDLIGTYKDEIEKAKRRYKGIMLRLEEVSQAVRKSEEVRITPI